jgi:hypothetical protein
MMERADRITAFRDCLTAMSMRNIGGGDQGKAAHRASITTINKVIENLLD